MQENIKEPYSPMIQLKGQWENYLTDKELAKIFKASKINVEEVPEIKPGQIINNKEFTAKVHAKIRCGGKVESNNILISFRLGPPTWEQFIRTTYKSASNVGIRIILYEGEGFDWDCLNNPIGNVSCIHKLVNINNNCGLKTYLIGARGLIRRIFEGKTNQVSYGYENCPTANDNPPATLPSMRQVQEAEFWTCYYLPAWNQSYDEVMGLYGNGEEWAQVYKDLSLPIIWSDEGLYLNIFGEADSKLVKLIWDNRL